MNSQIKTSTMKNKHKIHFKAVHRNNKLLNNNKTIRAHRVNKIIVKVRKMVDFLVHSRIYSSD